MKYRVPVDFETLPILQRPKYPPLPVGLAIRAPDGGAHRYLSWGHIGGNNTASEAEAKETLWRFWSDPSVELVFQNAKFDLAVAQERWGFPPLPWHRVHDIMFKAFLLDPHARSIGLKQMAHDWLGMPPEEQDRIAQWVQAHKRQLEARWSAQFDGLKVSKGKEGAWIFATPADLAGPYAVGDIVRTERLFDLWEPLVERAGMTEAYDRERKLLPVLIENESQGIRVDMETLEQDVEEYGNIFDYVETELRRYLRASGLNFDSDDDVAAVLIERGAVDVQDFALTKTGKYSMSKENLLPEVFKDKTVAQALGYRNRLATCLNMFMRPWLAQAKQYGGYITTNWNQTRGYDAGTRTGRPSTNKHNFLNISKNFEGRDDQYEHPAFLGVRPLPLCRNYVTVGQGKRFLHRDFSGQELRVFAHFEQGDLYNKYQEDPNTDPHKFVGEELMRVAHRDIERTRVKTLNFQGMYGGGVPALQKKLRCSAAEAKQLKAFHDQALPGRRLLNEEIAKVIRRGDWIRTWGGRLYKAEPPGPDGRDKIYKLINYIIQGSAADLTKEAIVDWWYHPDRDARFLVTVYDEINVEAPDERWQYQMELLRLCMERPRLTVPMLSDGKQGIYWGKLEKCA